MYFAVALFIGNIVSVGLTGFLVPWVANRFGWWLQPAPGNGLRANLLGAGLILCHLCRHGLGLLAACSEGR